MAVKKCDEEIIESEVEVATTAPAAATETPVQYLSNASIGKNILAVERDIYDDLLGEDGILLQYASAKGLLPTVSTFGNGYIRNARPTDISDPLRAEARKFFAPSYERGAEERSDVRVVYVNSDSSELGPCATDALTEIYGTSPITLTYGSVTFTQTQNNPSFIKTYTQAITISSKQFIGDVLVTKPQKFTNDFSAAWKAYTDGLVDGVTGLQRTSPIIDEATTFTDHHTNILAPFSPEELEIFANILNNPAYAKVESKYNFYVPGYEDFLQYGDDKNPAPVEWYLENQFSNMTRERSSYQQDLHNLGSDLQYAKGFMETPGIFSQRFNHIGIPQESVSDLKKFTDTDDLYPMLSIVEMKTETSGKFGLAAETSGMTNELLKHVMDQTIIFAGSFFASALNSKNFLISSEIVAQTPNSSNPDLPILITNQDTIPIPLINITPWIEGYLNGDPEELNELFDKVAILLGLNSSTASSATASQWCNSFGNMLKSLILSGKIEQMVNDHFRSYQEMMEGKEAYNEALIYEIDIGPGIQKIFIPNLEELDILQYFNSQVKYNKNYKYQIYVHQLVLGTSYTYRDFTGGGTSGNKKMAAAIVDYTPSLQIARIPIFSQNTTILDHAPVFPNVEIIPFKGINNRVLINLDGNTGNYELDPIIITDSDAEFVEKYREERGLSSSDPITFKSDDPVSEFEIFRLSEPPKSYADFNNQSLGIVSTPNATSTSYIDAIMPNTKYYYTFRAIDVHGNRSNPTDVYVIELVEFEGMIFFNQRIYEFESDTYDNVKTNRSFKRYLKVNPNLIQSLINYDALGEISSAYDASNISLGQASKPVWDKKFKMRITSKNSGKKFDININCKVSYNKQRASEPHEAYTFADAEAQMEAAKSSKK